MTVHNLPNFIAQSIVKKNAKYSIRTLEPLANFAAEPVVLFAGKDSPFNTVFDIVDYARANPGKVTLNGSGLFVWGGRSVCEQACQGRNGQRLLPALRR